MRCGVIALKVAILLAYFGAIGWAIFWGEEQ
jgi:hypothetical protein